MKIAITGGSGFVGRHLAQRLAAGRHELVLLGRTLRAGRSGLARSTSFAMDISSPTALEEAFAGCDAVAHCAGINREICTQTYERVHVDGTRNVVRAAKSAGVRKIAFMSFLRARPNCGSRYHESKWAAEEIVRSSGLDFTIVKAGMVFGRGDHMLDHLSHSLRTLPVFATVGLHERAIRPLAIEDLVHVLESALLEGRLSRTTLALTGPEELLLSEAVQRVAHVLGKHIVVVPAPVWFHYLLAQIFETTMVVPLVAKAQVRILSEGVLEPATPCDPVPEGLTPLRPFDDSQIRKGLPVPGPFDRTSLRCCLSNAR